MDLLGGDTVHAVRGERARYQPLGRTFPQFPASRLDEVVEHYHLGEAYVADLDRIGGAGDNLMQVRTIVDRCRVMLDWGVRSASDLAPLDGIDLVPVLGSETCPYRQMREAAERRECSASIDVRDGAVLTPEGVGAGVLEWALRLDALPLRDVLLLDLRRVGAEQGPNLPLAEIVVSATGYPVLVGGGVRGAEDLEALEAVGAAGAVVATAAHRGAIPAERLAREVPAE